MLGHEQLGALCRSRIASVLTPSLVVVGGSKGPFPARFKPSKWPRHPGSSVLCVVSQQSNGLFPHLEGEGVHVPIVTSGIIFALVPRR